MNLRPVTLHPGADLDGFRSAARALAAERIAPDQVVWTAADAPSLYDRSDAIADVRVPPLLLPRAVSAYIDEAVPHRDPERYALLYALIWRVLHGERSLIEIASDPLVR